MDGLMDQIFSEDPYLAFKPAFAYALPIQLLVSGITLTLLCVLAIHLICTSLTALSPLSPSLSIEYKAACTCADAYCSYDAISLPPCTSQLHTPIFFHPYSAHIRLHPHNSHITTFIGECLAI